MGAFKTNLAKLLVERLEALMYKHSKGSPAEGSQIWNA